MNTDEPRTLEQRARRRVGLKMGFYIHALVFVLVNLGLYLLANVFEVPRWSARHTISWNTFPLLGWGLGLLIHGIVTFISLQGDGLRERLLRREIQRLERRDAR